MFSFFSFNFALSSTGQHNAINNNKGAASSRQLGSLMAVTGPRKQKAPIGMGDTGKLMLPNDGTAGEDVACQR